VANQWYHIAVVRSGTGTNQTVIYTNGVAGTAGTCAQSFTQAGPVIGGNGYLGYISNLRIVKGSAVYTSAFTPPTAPLTNITNTSLLTCQSNRFVDNGTANSGSGFAITPSGDVSVQAFSPFLPTAAYSAATVGGSAYFDGTGDYLQSASSTTLQLGSSDFSIEWWEYRDVVGSDDTPVTTGDYAVAYGVMLLGYSGQAGFISTNGSSWNVLASPAYIDTLNAKSWNHFVYTRSGTAFRVFMNGKLSNYATGSGSVTQNNNQFNLGGNTGGGQYSFPGYIAGFRVVKGSIPTDYQTSSTTTGTVVFTPPAAPPTTTSQGATANDVELLLNMTNAAITDATAKNDLETVGNAQISTTQSKFGGSSMYFDGTGDYLKVPSSPNLALGTGDFTVEFWAYPTTFVNFSQWVSTRVADDASYWGIDSNSSGVFYFFTNGIVVQSSAQSLNTWVHIAAVRSGTTFKLYINGVSAGSATLTNNFLIANGLGVGAGANGAQTAYGYIDDVRITRGYARYTSNFTPPTSAFALQ
jgi:hypothetical protein